MFKGLQLTVSLLVAVAAVEGGKEHNARYLGESDGFELFVEWRECGGPDLLCSAIEECVDGECVCPEGHVNDGFRGCIDKDECATDYPCPGIEGISSFCVDRDPINDYYKCGCLPGYDPVYPAVWNSDIPIEFRPQSCDPGQFVSEVVQTYELSGIDPDTDPDVVAEQIKAEILANLGLRRRLVDEETIEYRSEVKDVTVIVTKSDGKFFSKNIITTMIVVYINGSPITFQELEALLAAAQAARDAALAEGGTVPESPILDGADEAVAAQNEKAEERAAVVEEAQVKGSTPFVEENAVIIIVVTTDPPTSAPTADPTSLS